MQILNETGLALLHQRSIKLAKQRAIPSSMAENYASKLDGLLLEQLYDMINPFYVGRGMA